MSMGKRLSAEFLGTFWLVLGGCGSAVLAAKFGGDSNPLGIGFLGVALAFGLTVVTGAASSTTATSMDRASGPVSLREVRVMACGNVAEKVVGATASMALSAGAVTTPLAGACMAA